jgi:hypothetical protein
MIISARPLDFCTINDFHYPKSLIEVPKSTAFRFYFELIDASKNKSADGGFPLGTPFFTLPTDILTVRNKNLATGLETMALGILASPLNSTSIFYVDFLQTNNLLGVVQLDFSLLSITGIELKGQAKEMFWVK